MKEFLDSIKALLFFSIIGAFAFGIGGMLTIIVIKILVWFYGVLF